MKHMIRAVVVVGMLCGGAFSQDAVDPIELIRQTDAQFQQVRSYTCKATSICKTYHGKKVSTYQDVVEYSFQKPKSIKMKWLAPWNIRGQVAIYSDEQLKVHLNFLPMPMSIDPNGKVAKDAGGNRIYNTDFGAVIRQIMDIKKDIPETEVTYLGIVQSNGRQVDKVSLRNHEGLVYYFVDRELLLPVAIEQYTPEMQLVTAAYFEDLKVNVAMSPYEFVQD
ncbi:MAG TPA: hypothetical protein P5287_04005 [bacterium]|nr:hypothetical protein [bacterium]